MKFTRETLIDVLNDEAGRIISDEITSTGRWVINYALTFEYNGQFYRTDYQRGATEYQDEDPWENEEVVDCTEVVPVEKTIITYVTKGE